MIYIRGVSNALCLTFLPFFPIVVDASALLLPVLTGGEDYSSSIVLLFLKTLEVRYFVSECFSVFIIFFKYVNVCLICLCVTDPLMTA